MKNEERKDDEKANFTWRQGCQEENNMNPRGVSSDTACVVRDLTLPMSNPLYVHPHIRLLPLTDFISST